MVGTYKHPGKVTVFWLDKGGNIDKTTFYVDTTGGLSGLATPAGNVIGAIEAVSDAQFVSAEIEVPLALTLTNQKTSAVAGSTARRSMKTFFNSAPGDPGVPSIIEIEIPDPVDGSVDYTGKRLSLKVADTNTAAWLTATIGHAYSFAGYAAASLRNSYLRQRAVTVRSKQAA